MNFQDFFEAFFATDAGQLAMWVLVLPVLDWALGILAAFRDGTFQLDKVYAVAGKHWPRIVAIWALLVVGYLTSNWTLPVVDAPAITTIGIGAALAYLAETVGSILRSWGPKAPPGEPQTLLNRDPVQPVPNT